MVDKIKDIIQKLDFKAIALGFVIDWVISLLFGVFFYGLVYKYLYSNGYSSGEVEELLLSTTWHKKISLLTGMAFTGLGAFFAMKFSSTKHIYNAIAVGVVSLATGISYVLDEPFWYKSIAILGIIPVAYYGGKLYLQKFHK